MSQIWNSGGYGKRGKSRPGGSIPTAWFPRQRSRYVIPLMRSSVTRSSSGNRTSIRSPAESSYLRASPAARASSAARRMASGASS